MNSHLLRANGEQNPAVLLHNRFAEIDEENVDLYNRLPRSLPVALSLSLSLSISLSLSLAHNLTNTEKASSFLQPPHLLRQVVPVRPLVAVVVLDLDLAAEEADDNAGEVRALGRREDRDARAEGEGRRS